MISTRPDLSVKKIIISENQVKKGGKK